VETEQRSLVKAITYRVLGTLFTMSLLYAVTKKLNVAVELGLYEAALKMVVYYLHERLWSRVGFGRVIEESE